MKCFRLVSFRLTTRGNAKGNARDQFANVFQSERYAVVQEQHGRAEVHDMASRPPGGHEMSLILRVTKIPVVTSAPLVLWEECWQLCCETPLLERMTRRSSRQGFLCPQSRSRWILVP